MIKNLLATWETWVQSPGWEDPLEKGWLPTPVFLPGESHGQRSLVNCSPWGRKESDTTEPLSLHILRQLFLLSAFWLSLAGIFWCLLPLVLGFPSGSDSKASVCNAGDLGSIPGLGRSPGEGNAAHSSIFLPGKSHGLQSLLGYHPWGHKELDTTEGLHFFFFFFPLVLPSDCHPLPHNPCAYVDSHPNHCL